MNFVEWEPVRSRRNSIALRYQLPPHYGYPFSMSFHIEYTVDENGASGTLVAENTGNTHALFGTANRPYLAAPTDSVDSLELTLPAETHYTTDERLTPTGKASVFGTPYDFRPPRRLGETPMDTAFSGLTRDADGHAVVRFGWPGRGNVELGVDQAPGYLQVYTDDSPGMDRPTRSGITVEPMTLRHPALSSLVTD